MRHVDETAWRDPSDTNPNKRAAREIRGYRYGDPITPLETRGTIDGRQARAFRKFRAAWEVAIEGASPGRDLSGGGSQSTGSGMQMAEIRMLKLAEVRDVCSVAGKRGSWLLIYLLGYNAPQNGGNTLRSFAEASDEEAKVIKGVLVSTLDRVADHYEPAQISIVDEILHAIRSATA